MYTREHGIGKITLIFMTKRVYYLFGIVILIKKIEFINNYMWEWVI